MNTFRVPTAARPSGHFWRMLALLSLSSWPALAALDLNNDGVGDVWALKYNAVGLSTSADTDGDGKTNAEEAIAGTDPRGPDSRLEITSITMDVNGVHITWLSAPGKRYRVQSTDSFEPADWQDEPGSVLGTGAYLTAELDDENATGRYYRVVVDDVDSDNDGLTDWEEKAVGYDSSNQHSAGASELDDLTRLTQALQGSSQITVTAVDTTASEVGKDPATFVISRKSGIVPVTVNLNVSGTATSGTDYEVLPTSVTLGLAQNSAVVTVTPIIDNRVESPETVVLTAASGSGYTVGSPASDVILLSDSAAGVGTGLRAQYFNETSSLSFSPPTWGNQRATKIEQQVDFNYTVLPWPGGSVNPTNFAARWFGEVVPEFSQVYTFYLDMNWAGRVWVNGELLINNWPRSGYTPSTSEQSGIIQLDAGVRYPILVEFYDTTGNDAKAKLSWASANQVKQVIPKARLLADTAPLITSATEVTLLKNSGAYTYAIKASGFPTAYTATNLPPNWNLNPQTGVISGSPAKVGTWRIPITAENTNGKGAAVLILTITETGGTMTREVWDGPVADFAALEAKFSTPTTRTNALAYFESSLNDGGTSPTEGQYGARIRGYLTPPSTGVYQFWLSADDQAELWISNDDDPVNLLRRAKLTTASGYRDWDNAVKSPLLWLVAGQRYYVEVRHIESGGADHVSIGWRRPTDPDTGSPNNVIPGYAMSPWVESSEAPPEGVLYTATLTPQGAADSHGYGLSTLRLSADGTKAIVSFNFANLTGPVMQKHVHDDRLPGGANIVFDLDQPDVEQQQDGSYVWPIVGVASLSAAQVAEGIRRGNAYFNIHTPRYMSGEIKGYYRRQDGSSVFTPPAPAPSWPDDHGDANAAARFLNQATFGASEAEITSVQSLGYEGWIDNQFTKAPTLHYPDVFANRNQTNPNGPVFYTALTTNSWWKNSIRGQDQLRQRLAFALSEIMVVSSLGVLEDRSDSLSSYYDTLLNGSFGNFRDLLEAVTLTPAMGRYLDMLRNDKPDRATGRIPNENYAREILQLFSIGLNRMHPDGSLVLSSKGLPIPTYDQDAIIGFAHAFTGWTYNQANAGSYLPTNWNPAADWINPMKQVPGQHYVGQKRLLNNEVLPGLSYLDPFVTHTTAQIQSPAYQALAAQELDATHDAIFNHPNVGPFICRQLIQRFVTSTPSRGYIYRVVQKFNDNGAGVRGDLKAVVKAILLDYEARSDSMLDQQGFGKQREPVIRAAALARAFPETAAVTGTYVQNGAFINITTATPHRLMDGNWVNLDFTTGTPTSHDGFYGGSGTLASVNYLRVTSTTAFTVRAKDAVDATYSQTGNVITLTTGAPHGLATGDPVYSSFTGGTPSVATSGRAVATVLNSTQFTVPAADSVTRNGAAVESWFRGSYTQPGGGTSVTQVTVTTTLPHGLVSGNTVYLRFTATIGQATTPTDGQFINISVLDAFRFQVTSPITPTARSGTLVGAGQSATLSRSGNVSTAYSNWQLGNTETDLGQTPLRALSVFNFFEPDYQFPGPLAEAGLITPEFQLTSDTNVIRQANFIFGGLTSPANDFGVSSLRSGGGHICLDLGRWMQNHPTSGTPWTNNENLDLLIAQLNTLLCAGQMEVGTVQAPGPLMIIKNYVQNTANVAYNNTTPSDINKRDRLRAIVHLMTAAPDFAIQK